MKQPSENLSVFQKFQKKSSTLQAEKNISPLLSKTDPSQQYINSESKENEEKDSNKKSNEDNQISYPRTITSKNEPTIYFENERTVLLNSDLQKDINIIPNFNYEGLQLLEILGRGGFSVVQKAYDKKNGKYLALKYFDKGLSEHVLNQIKLEDNLLTLINGLNSIHFLKYHGVFKDPNQEEGILLSMESGLATLDDILESGKVYESEEIFFVFLNLIEGLSMLQENGIANRDLKPQNIILVKNLKTNEATFSYKIADFGIGCLLEKNVHLIDMKTINGMTLSFSAPEVKNSLLYKNFGGISTINESNIKYFYHPFKADVYSLGLVLLKMIGYDCKNFENYSIFNVLQKIEKENKYANLLPFLIKMLEEEPQKRPDFISLKVWLQSFVKENSFNLDQIYSRPKNEMIFYKIWKNKTKPKSPEKFFLKVMKLRDDLLIKNSNNI